MGKKDFIHGSILEFVVPLDLGFAYCKIFDFRNIREFDGVLVKVFDNIVKKPLNEISILREKDWLFGARRMPWLPGTRGKGAWKLKGVLIGEDDNVIPDFKYCIKSSPFVEDESKLEPWDAVKNINKYVPSPYENVKHLEDTVVSPSPAIEIRTAMEYCRINGIDIKKHFDLSTTINELIFKQMIKVPIYKTIPKEIRGKALISTSQKNEPH
jgi:hypothetical protein